MAPIHDLYERYAADVCRFALYLSGEPADAEDITADTFVRLWTTSGEIRTRTVKAYLFTIARHLYLDRQRARARFTDLDDSPPSSTPNAEDRATVRSEVEHVKQAIAQLPEADRTALLMRASGLSYEEIADAIGASVGAVKVRVQRARKRIGDAQRRWPSCSRCCRSPSGSTTATSRFC
jgi:RNA polymerase sigma-70 factor (ECF subfamily)